MLVSNHPQLAGGSHLPDITVITPVWAPGAAAGSPPAFFVASLQSMGCQVALDDFGSGYTSFRQLKALSVDMVKIDGIFIKDLVHSADNQFFVKTLLDFTHGFGLSTVAEFVENGEITKILLDMGVDYMQGYYFGKPENRRSWLNEGEYKGE